MLYTGDIFRQSTGEAEGVATGKEPTADSYLFVGGSTGKHSPDTLYAASWSFASGKGDIGLCVISRVRLKGK